MDRSGSAKRVATQEATARWQSARGRAVLVYENQPPTRIDLLPWYRNRRYREFLTNTMAAKSSP